MNHTKSRGRYSRLGEEGKRGRLLANNNKNNNNNNKKDVEERLWENEVVTLSVLCEKRAKSVWWQSEEILSPLAAKDPSAERNGVERMKFVPPDPPHTVSSLHLFGKRRV